MPQANNASHSGNRLRVAVLFGGESDEHDVSLRSAQTVMSGLDPEKYEVVPVGITREGRWLTGDDSFKQLTERSPLFALEAQIHEPKPPFDLSRVDGLPAALPSAFGTGVDVVFPVLHGPRGEDGTIQGMLELANLPFVGSGVLGSALAMDKAMAKLILAQANMPQGPWLLVNRAEWERDPVTIAERIEAEIGFPCFVKPANMGSSVGVAKVHDAEELNAGMSLACQYDRKVLAEQAIDAREIEVAVLGNDLPIASVPGEVVPSNEFYDYAAKYIDDRSELIIPADIPAAVAERAGELAVAAFKALDLAGLARVDFFLERGSDRLLINEINTLPGFTAISMYPRLWEASGIPLPDLMERLLDLAQERHAERRR
ncbi:MAG TPA: D-alanine--D-alanine ligase family protein [Thermomicrobiales bacterium]|nr:D-alanine--D-alanine ligase family protein [Thermomicrobiales bacterium]